MGKALNLLAYDLGASSGRAILGAFDGSRIALSELHRFPNDPVMLCGRFSWDTPRLFFEMQKGLLAAAREGVRVDGIGIDTWGVDFGLLDAGGHLLGNPLHYRDARNDGMMDKAFGILPKERIFEHTGLAFLPFNSLYQLLAARLTQDPLLDVAHTLLFMPDLLAYFLTGEKLTEYTIASTSQLIDAHTRDWSPVIAQAFSLNRALFTAIQQPGSLRGTLLPSLASELGVERAPLIAVGSHDTASAVAAVPASGDDFAYISSGTWSLLGAELPAPVCTAGVMNANYTNEGGVCGTTRVLKNIMGLWIIQECKREWDRREDAVDFAGLVRMAEKAEPFIAMIDPDDPAFLAPGDMPARVQEYCRQTGQRVPRGRGEISRVVYESLALKYRWSIERLEQDILMRPVRALHIVGGGSRNELLNRFTASAVGKPVYAGPSEATAIGNVLVQAMALGEISGLAQLREVVRASFPCEVYEPEGRAAWDDVYARFTALLHE